MPFLTSKRGSGSVNAARAFSNADASAIRVKASAEYVKARAQASTLTASDLIDNLRGTLVTERAILDAASQTPGVAAYAAEQFPDVAGYDVTAAYQAMIIAIDDTIAWLITNYPLDAEGCLKKLKWAPDSSGNLVAYDDFSAGQLSAVVTQCDALIATID